MDAIQEVDPYEQSLIDFDLLEEVLEPEEWPGTVMKLMRHHHGRNLPVLTRRQILAIQNRLNKPGEMMKATLPLTCVGEGINGVSCPYVPGCPLVDAGIAPIGKICPFEDRMTEELFTSYIKSLEVETNNMVEMGIVKDIVSLDLLINRATGNLSRDGLIDLNAVGVTSIKTEVGFDQEVLYRRDASAAAIIIEKLLLRKSALLKSMMATREMQARKHGEKDDSSDFARMIQKMKELKASVAE